ncbi:MAG TPA: aliphatic sulfonate ABC transporter substrate-binding protein [Alphaproteobacteria bacterium]|nr:aliphatic sulfonate ABC transporter substrate-binding protein [Alphaproteobacteria bacterium]
MTKLRLGWKIVAALGLSAAVWAFGAERPLLAAEAPSEIRLDYAYYNPVSLLIKEKAWVEDEFKADGIAVRWVLSLGSNKALEFLNAGSLDFGSTAGAAALLGRINGNPIKSIYVYSKPEWTALVTTKESTIDSVADLKGKRIAVTRGTDPHIFLVRALQGAGLTEKDVTLVLLQHHDGRAALDKGDVDAWAGLDPMMAQAEIENADRIFFRDPDLNTYGVLNVREAFATRNPLLVGRVLAVYERGRRYALEHPDELKAVIAKAARLSDAVAARQLERTDLRDAAIGEKQRRTIEAAGLALQQAGVIASDVDVPATVTSLIDPQYTAKLALH